MRRSRPDAVLRYDDRAEAVIDVHLPRGTPTGLIVFLHGGFWKTTYDRLHARPLARALADEGWAVAMPEYRRVGPGGGGGWPVTVEDVQLATRRLPDLLAGIDVVPTTTVLSGHSAGGHLALWLADETDARIVALAPVCDLRESARLHLGGDAAQAFMGGTPDRVDYDPADPMARLTERPGVVVVLHGDADENVPVGLSRGLARRHPWVDLRELPGVGHFEFLEPGSPAWRPLLDALSPAEPG